MANAKIGDLNIYYEMEGKGPPLVLIQGYTCSYRFWDPMMRELAARFRVVRFDNRGSGFTTDQGESFTLDTMAADTAALIAYLGLGSPAIVGHSMGGAIAQTLIERFPAVCGKSVVLNSMRSTSRQATALLEGLLALRKADVDDDFLIDATLRLLSGPSWLSIPSNLDAARAAVKSEPAPQSVEDQARQLDALKHFDATPYRSPPPKPVLVISSTDDILTPVSDGERIAEALGATHRQIRTGHPSVVEQPEILLPMVGAFLSD
jgi:pimeloyl-ACP methyl ester carboxylesterase